MSNLPANTYSKVKFRQNVLGVQNHLQKLMDDGKIDSILDECTLKHYFTPIDEKYGCCSYARQIFVPKGSVIIGKIHKHEHLNFIMTGEVMVSTEFGKKHYKAPSIFVSEVGLKRAVFAVEDTIWATVHLTQHHGEENLDKIEDEVIAKSYEEMGLISDLKKLLGDTK